MTKFLNISTDNTLGGNSPSDDVVSSQKAIATKIGTKQDTLVSGINIKTINNQSILGAGNIDTSGSGGGYHPGILSWEWDDHLRNDVQWLRGDTFSWQDGEVYEAAYQHLVDDYDSANWIIITGGTKYIRASGYDTTKGQYDYYGWKEYEGSDVVYTVDTQAPQINRAVYHSTSISLPAVYANVTDTPFIQETIENINVICRVGTDGHKICLPGQESNVAAIYAATGVAWYYILDTANQRFKLPRAKHNKYESTLGVVGNGMTLGLTNGSDYGGLASQGELIQVTLGMVKPVTTAYGESVTNTGSSRQAMGGTWGVTPDASKSGVIAKQEDESEQYKYLYFYVGEFTQTALENTAGLNAELFNEKADVDFNNTQMIDYVIEFQRPTSANNYTWYRKYSSGWVEQGGRATTSSISFPVTMADTNYQVMMTQTGGSSAYAAEPTNHTTTGFTYWQYQSVYSAYWQVSGLAA